MIKVSIAGGETPDGGELLRLLAMHPEVELLSVSGKGVAGKPVSSHHHGLIGETDVTFSDTVDCEKCDVLFVCSDILTNADICELHATRPDLKIIVLGERTDLDREDNDIVYGLPEINRKQLVRGATAAVVPQSFATMALVALFPFASNLLLNEDIKLRIAAPKSMAEETDIASVKREIEKQLQEVQKSFAGNVDIEINVSNARRSSLMEVEFPTTLTIEQIKELYDIYDDHRFAYVTTTEVGVSEVAGTNKCVMSICKPDNDNTRISVVADCRMRGAAGEAVHIMNLMCGLHEKTGLALKAIDFEPV